MRTNLHAIRLRIDRLAGRMSRSLDGEHLIAILHRGRQRCAAEHAARIASGVPEPVLNYEEHIERARAFRAHMRALGVLPPLRNSEGA